MTQVMTDFACCLSATLCVATVTGDAEAVMQERVLNANPTSYCQTALPVFDGNVRKRPLAVQNEGDTPAFVTCSFAAQTEPLQFVGIAVRNNSSAAVTVSCTGVTGAVTTAWVTGEPNQYVTKSEQLPPSGANDLIWSGLDFAGAPAVLPGDGLFNVSCSLAPGVGLNGSFVLFDEDVAG